MEEKQQEEEKEDTRKKGLHKYEGGVREREGKRKEGSEERWKYVEGKERKGWVRVKGKGAYGRRWK